MREGLFKYEGHRRILGVPEGRAECPKGCKVAFYIWGTSQFGLATVQVSHSHSPVAAMQDRRER